MNVMFIELF